MHNLFANVPIRNPVIYDVFRDVVDLVEGRDWDCISVFMHIEMDNFDMHSEHIGYETDDGSD